MMLYKSPISLWMSPITKLLGVALIFVNTLFWFMPDLAHSVAIMYSGIDASHYTLTPSNRFLGWLISSLQVSVLSYGFFTVASIFQDFANGIWFADSFSNKIKRFGISLLIFSLLSPVVQALTGLALTYSNPVTQRMISISFEIDGKGMIILLVGILLIFIGKVIAEATRLADENSQII
ncbi:MAG: hypothetical protein KAH00_04745 [Cocleimonas sp.]|nr:hypothetical protein [Cocleimonas sp.]